MEVNNSQQMANIDREKYEKLKKDYLDAEQISLGEKNLLIKAINTLSPLLSVHAEYQEQIGNIKKILNENTVLPVDTIENEIDLLKKKIFSEESKAFENESQQNGSNEQHEYHLKTSNMIKRVQVALTDSFYPITDTLKPKSDTLKTCCNGDVNVETLNDITNAFLNFINALKLSISDDFQYVNQTFFSLSEQIRELEVALLSDFGNENRKKEIEKFESNINSEMGSIVNAFSIHSTIDQVKKSVIGKIGKIKQIISQRKEEELRKSQNAQEHISSLKKRIEKAEKDAQDMSQKAQHFEVVATKDKLTNLYNRHAFDNRLNNAIDAVNTGAPPFSLAIFDIDNFKWINDTFGHISGDKVLKRVADCLSESFRKDDFIARYGGDEFAVILESMSEEKSRKRIELFNNIFQKKRFRSPETGDVNVSISVGIAIAKAGENPETLIDRADKDMYIAKKNKPKLPEPSTGK